MTEGMKEKVLYPLQEAVLERLRAMDNPQFNVAKLCGGTALSRCWLHHRLSYDLDFFLPEGFKALDLAGALKKSGVDYETRSIVDDRSRANQLHGYVVHQGQRLKVSFIEDAYFNLYPAVATKFGGLTVLTEEISGLYHRKLRTVAGSGAEGDSFEGERQTARDLFDLYVLSSTFRPIRDFIQSLPYAFPSEAFDNGLSCMPWLELIEELGQIVCDPAWNKAKNITFLQIALYGQIGAVPVIDDIGLEARQERLPMRRALPKKRSELVPEAQGSLK